MGYQAHATGLEYNLKYGPCHCTPLAAPELAGTVISYCGKQQCIRLEQIRAMLAAPTREPLPRPITTHSQH